MDVIWYVVGGVVFILAVVLVMWLSMKSKGRIIIQLNGYQFSPGDTIEGTVVLDLKKQVEAKALNVGLLGMYKSTSYSGSGGLSHKTRTGKAFEFKQPLDGEKVYNLGRSSYNFKLIVPRDLLSSRALGNDMLGTVVKSVKILSGNMSRIDWYVTANLEIKGLDISKKVRVNIG
ncbi:MAG: hypothetical protein KKD18_04245 [Nanoarchaeota archaeon]|nr:hypothetical protein [Nanoarchaeota archaeon]MBU0977601.1 hypothetical protein [Nanoarchaeota archaeon]